MSVIINIVLILVSLILIVAVLMQEGNKQGLGAIGGAAETFLGKNKAKGYEGKLLLITKAAAAVFVVIAVLATWMNARTWTVQYYVDGEEYFPAYESNLESIAFSQVYGLMTEEQAAEQIEALSKLDVEDKRDSYSKGEEIYAYSVPEKEGHTGEWKIVKPEGVTSLPKTMDKKNYVLEAVYTIGKYTLTFTDGHIEGDATEGEAHEHATLCEPITKLFGATISEAEIPALPVVEGYTATWSEAIPTNMPGFDMVISVEYELIPTEEEPTPAEPTPAESTPAESTEEEPTPAEPTDTEPTAAEPTAIEPTAVEPTTTEPTGAEA